MPRPRRMYIARNVYFATARIRSGLPLVPDKLVNAVLKGILARGQHLYPTEICHALFMANHFHMVFVCYDAKRVADFFGYIKGEIGYAINKLTGKRGPVWEGRTDTPRVATADEIIEEIIYLYTNPQKAGLVDKIEDYPGVNSWSALINEECEEACPWYMTSELEKIPRTGIEKKLRGKLLKKLESELKDNNSNKLREQHTLTFNPLGWVELYSELSKEEVKQQIIGGVREKEAELRHKQQYRMIGSDRLKAQSIYRRHTPKKFGKRVFVICRDLELRKRLISEYRDFKEHCQEIYLRWKYGDFSQFFPPGAFAPPACRIANALY